MTLQGPVLPYGHTVHDLVGDRGDRLAGDVGAMNLGQVSADFPGGHAFRGQRQDHVLDTGQPPLPL